jgi:hypothetical protein
MRHTELKLTKGESDRLRLVLKFALGSLFALDMPNDADYRGYRTKKRELEGLIHSGLRDVWSVAKKLEDATQKARP